MEILSHLGFDFDEMARLAATNPEEFARRREALIHQLVKRARQPEDLVSLQMDLDAMRYGSAPGIRSSKRMHDMMLTKLDLLDGYLDIYTELAKANPE